MSKTFRRLVLASILPTLLQGCATLGDSLGSQGAISETNLADARFAQCIADHGYQKWAEVTKLDCRNYGIVRVDELSLMPNLERLTLGSNRITTLDTSHNPKLTSVMMDGNSLTSADFSANPKLKRLSLDRNKLSELTLGSAEQLTTLYAYKNPLVKIDLVGKAQLQYLGLSEHQLTSVDLSGSPKLVSLNLTQGTLAQLDVGHNPLLQELRVSRNQLRRLDLSHNTGLTYVNAELNRLEQVELGNSAQLTQLYLGQNRLTQIELGQATQIEKLRLNHNQLAELDLSSLSGLKSAALFQNPLGSLTLPEGVERQIIDATNTPWGARHSVSLTIEPLVELVTSGLIVDRGGRKEASGFRNVLADHNDLIGVQYSVEWPEGADANKLPKQIPVLVRVTHPELTMPSGETFRQVEWPDNMYINNGNLAMWQFSEPWTMVPGRWQFEVIYNDKVVVKDAMLVQFPIDEEKAKQQLAEKLINRLFDIDDKLCRDPQFRQCMAVSADNCLDEVKPYKERCRARISKQLSLEQAKMPEVLKGAMIEFFSCLIKERDVVDQLAEEDAVNCRIPGS